MRVKGGALFAEVLIEEARDLREDFLGLGA
jgi:hypothetical protein